LRLDVRDDALAAGALAPGKPEESLLVERITSTDPETKMPPPDSHRSLSAAQIETLIGWVRQGAAYDKHWAFKAVERPAPPASPPDWGRNDIDGFVLERLAASGLAPSPRAPVATLLRRLSLDLVGLPPSAEQLARWQVAAEPADAAIEELLASPHYGERMAVEWLDVARYADTHGFNNDSARTMWPWRDWVVEALNANMPYDQFVVEQLAGDLLPGATARQQLATGFNRNHVINSEGGIIDEEYRVEYVADRVRTTSMAWLGLTLECARCHDHKFDPVSQREYYQFFAFFNNIDETGEDGRVANAAPLTPAPSAEESAQLRGLRQAERRRRAELGRLLSDAASRPVVTADTAEATTTPGGAALRVAAEACAMPQAFPAGAMEITPSAALGPAEGWVLSAWVRRGEAQAGPLISTMNYATPRSSGEYGRGVQAGLTSDGAVEVRLAVRWPGYATQVVSRRTLPLNQWSHVAVAVTGNRAGHVRIFVDGVESATIARRDGLTGDIQINGPVRVGRTNHKTPRQFVGQMQQLQLLAGPLPAGGVESVAEAAVISFADEASASELAPRQRWVADVARRAIADAQVADAWRAWRAARGERLAHERSFPLVMVMQELPTPRESFVLTRGRYDQHGERVAADVPQALGLPLPDGAPRNRLTLARWLTDPRHPLTARVVMNRLWQQFFGTGLVKTTSDFGMQSEWPSHPELLDWLAAELIASGWDLKHMVRLIAQSATYQQDSSAVPESWRRDLENRLLARGPRQRLTAEMIRDQALAASGLLNDALGGPPAFPYQPADYYNGVVVAAGYPGTTYEVGSGAGPYRRSLYTFWKRTVPHPTLTAFDSPDREFCVARRSATNTPLQALVLMNDPTFLEAARKLAERMLAEGGADDDARLAWGFRTLTAREPTGRERAMLVDLLNHQRREFASGASSPKALLEAGASARGTTGADDAELAAYASLGALLLNLDEVITRN